MTGNNGNNGRNVAVLGASALTEVQTIGRAMYASGMFTDVKSEAQAVVKIMAGRELGIPAIAAMMGINIIKGKVSLSANILAALIKRDDRYNYRIVTHTANECAIEFYEHGKLAYSSTFTIQDAQKAGLLDNPVWKQYPRNMLFSRALSNGARIVCPERICGLDLVAEDDDGNALPDVQTTNGTAVAQQTDAQTGEVVDVVIRATETTSQAVPAQQNDQPFAEALKNSATRANFWGTMKLLGLSQDDVHTAVNNDHMMNVPGTWSQVMATIEAFAKTKRLAKDADDMFGADAEHVAEAVTE